MIRRSLIVAIAGVLLGGTGVARAQCPVIDFENLAVGTQVTTQYAGVTFSGRNTNGTLAANPRIYQPVGGTSSPVRCLSAQGDGINEFSCEYIRMEFDDPQLLVTFNVGVRTGCYASDTVRIRAYNTSLALISQQDLPINGTVSEVCRTAVRVAGTNIRRVEVEYGVSPTCACAFELIDDLAFARDTTAPEASISLPAEGSCVCSGVSIVGTANDPDGAVSLWRLERRAVGVAAWTLINQSGVAVVDSQLSQWFPSASASEGYYVLRLTVTNACGMTSTTERVVYLDRAFDSFDLRAPASGGVYGGTVCFDGTMWDHCPPGAGVYTLAYAPGVGGVFNPVDPAHPGYDSTVINDPLGSWNTVLVADGSWRVQAAATTSCGFTASTVRTITVDNTAPIAVIASPTNCGRVTSGVVSVVGSAIDANISGWTLQYTGGAAHGWVTIASGGSNINGVLANWDTSSLPACAYTLRLVVADRANLNCTGLPHTSEYSTSVEIGCSADFNGDGDLGTDADIAAFFRVLAGGPC